MGLEHPKPYRKLNKITGLFEWIYPEAIEYDKKDKLKPITLPKKKKWKRK